MAVTIEGPLCPESGEGKLREIEEGQFGGVG
jgi:hypothetical protein